MVYKTVYTEVEVDVDISDFETEDLLEELESRGALPVDSNINAQEVLEAIWIKRRMDKDYSAEVDQLIYECLGKII
tara:strand:- start:726 stop:953 length:228 start_codon:yes stop_codon:yes gene_type:complete